MNANDVLRVVREHLSTKDLSRSGTIFYSNPRTTLKKGDYYILGLNPGGDPAEIKTTIEETVRDAFKIEAGWSAYTHEAWQRYKAGKAPHQRRVIKIAEAINQKVQKVFITNLIFERTRNDASLRDTFSSLSEKYFGVHKEFLKIIRPHTIICLGNGAFSAFAALHRLLNGCPTEFCHKKKLSFRSGKEFFVRNAIPELPQEVRVIGIAHPSRYDVPQELISYLRSLAGK